MEKKIFQRKKLKKAIVFGATGLVGQALVKQLLAHPNYGEVVCVNRREQTVDHEKYKEIISDLSNPGDLLKHLNGDDVFCCLGTTIKKAGSKKQFEKVDFGLPVAIGKLCEKRKISHYLVVSSIGANAESRNFYLRTKGRMEESVLKLNISQKTIVRPSMLLGPRKEHRFGEEAGKVFMKVFDPLLFGKWKKYRAIHVDAVSKSMLIIANSSPTGQMIFESDELKEIVDAES